MEFRNLQADYLSVKPVEPGILLSLVLPVYNYQNRLSSNLELVMLGLRDRKIPFEVILVNDGSRDLTGSEIRKVAPLYPELTVIDYPINRGKGYAVRQGILQARGSFVFFTDIDLPYGLEPIFKGLQYLQQGAVDLVLGSRDLPESKDIASYNWKRKITKKAFSLIVNSLFRLHIEDTQCGLKGFSCDAAKVLFTMLTRDDFSFDVELLYLAKRLNYRIQLTPVNLNQGDVSTVSVARDSLKMLLGVAQVFKNIIFNQYRIKEAARRRVQC